MDNKRWSIIDLKAELVPLGCRKAVSQEDAAVYWVLRSKRCGIDTSALTAPLLLADRRNNRSTRAETIGVIGTDSHYGGILEQRPYARIITVRAPRRNK